VKICPACQALFSDSAQTCSNDGLALVGGILEPGAVVRQKYRVLSAIGVGGMAAVYRARHLLWQEEYALKLLHQPGGPGFLAEAQILRRIDHPHVVRVEDADVAEDGRPFVVMELVEGESLREYIRRERALDPEEALRVAAETCSALEAAHAAGIIHRDIKPHNLLLARAVDGSATVKVIDFGIAKVREEAGLGFTGVLEGTTGFFVGTCDYASTEQALGKPLDGRSDVYSLGVVLYEMLTGSVPFRAETPMASLVKRLQEAPADPHRLRPSLPLQVCKVAMRALEREPEGRYASAAEMRRACETALESIQRERQEAIRRDEEARAKQAALEEIKRRRDERRRHVAESLRVTARCTVALLRRVAGRKRFLLATCGVLVMFAAGIYAGFGTDLKQEIEAKTALGSHAGTQLFAAPISIAVGDVSTAEGIAVQLRRAGYTESSKNTVGYYRISPQAIEIFPQRDSYFDQEPAVITLSDGRISRITSLHANSVRTVYQLEPQIITNFPSNMRQKRRVVSFHEIPAILIQAITSAEDRRFFQHSGIDLSAGATTITEKLARIVWGTTNRWEGALLALRIERQLAKEAIFETYANVADLGWRGTFNIRGFGQASETYLGKDLSQITLPEAAQLAGLIQEPDAFDPFRHPDDAKQRRNEVLTLMRQNGYISDRDYALAIEARLTVATTSGQFSDAPYFTDIVREELESKFQDTDLPSSGFRIYTTLDMNLQRTAMEALRNGMQLVDSEIRKQSRFSGQRPPQAEVALIAIDPHTGEVAALIGGRNYGVSQLNYALVARRPASIFKPFVYAAAMDTAVEGGSRIITPSTMVKDEPTTFWDGGRPYEPKNFDMKYRGDITIHDALVLSTNVTAVKVAEMVGYQKVVEMAKRAGLNEKILPTPAVALGQAEITPLEAAGAYTLFANAGEYVRPMFLRLVRSGEKVVFKQAPSSKRVLDPRVAALMNSLLEDVARSGTAADIRGRNGLSFPFAAATGPGPDGWFVGFTSELLCVVWVGLDDGRELGMDGATSAGAIWAEFMKAAVQYPRYRDAKPFGVPSGIVSIEIDPTSGMPATAACPQKRKELYVNGTQPVGYCRLHGERRVPRH
jgi:penicillin-binding protein 1B